MKTISKCLSGLPSYRARGGGNMWLERDGKRIVKLNNVMCLENMMSLIEDVFGDKPPTEGTCFGMEFFGTMQLSRKDMKRWLDILVRNRALWPRKRPDERIYQKTLVWPLIDGTRTYISVSNIRMAFEQPRVVAATMRLVDWGMPFHCAHIYAMQKLATYPSHCFGVLDYCEVTNVNIAAAYKVVCEEPAILDRHLDNLCPFTDDWGGNWVIFDLADRLRHTHKPLAISEKQFTKSGKLDFIRRTEKIKRKEA